MSKKGKTHERVLVTLPRPTATKLTKYAKVCRQGNKSGFVADAIEAYVAALHRGRHTRNLRQAYAASAEQALRVASEWQHVDEEVWAQLDRLEKEANG
jgi:hypothetical protein